MQVLAVAAAGAATPTGVRAFTGDYNGNGFGYDVSRIDVATGTLLGQIFVGQRPTGAAANAAGTRVYVAISGTDNLSVIDTTIP